MCLALIKIQSREWEFKRCWNCPFREFLSNCPYSVEMDKDYVADRILGPAER